MTKPPDAPMTGTWRGHYEQDGLHPIEMQVEQRGAIFTGWMRDRDTLTLGTAPVYDIDPQKEAWVEVDQCDFAAMLPELSVIEGTIDGRSVTFLKKYQGTATSSFWQRGHAIEHKTNDAHQVVYAGALDETQQTLRGHWRIGAPHGLPATTGAFELRRADQPTP